MKILAWFFSIALASNSLFAADLVRDFKLLFDTILTTKFSYKLTVDDQHIRLLAESDAANHIKAQLDKALSSQASFFANLPYHPKGIDYASPNSSLMNAQDIPDFNASSVEEAVAVIINLVGESAFDSLSVDIHKIFSVKTGAMFDNGVLYSKPIEKIAIPVYREIFKVIMAHFIDIKIEDIKAAYLNPDQYLTTPANIPEDSEIHGVSGLLQKCFGILQTTAGTRAFIDVSRIYQLIFPPKIALLSGERALEIKRDHLMTYMQQVNGDRVLLRVFDKEGQKFAHPMVLSEGSHVNKAQYNIILIDHSSSLRDYYENLTGHIKNFIKKLDASNPANQVKLVFFGEKVDPRLFSICDAHGIECAIDSTKKNLEGHTRLFHTLRDVFHDIHHEDLIAKYNVSVTVFTDGVDNVGGSFQEIQSKINAIPAIARPKVFTLGFGGADVRTLTQLATTMGGPYIPLKSIHDFIQIEEHLQEFKNERDLIEFAFNLCNQQHVFTIPVPMDNAPHPLNIVLPMTGYSLPVTVQGKQMVAMINQDTSVSSANMTDKIWLLSAQASGIAIDKNYSAQEKITKLMHILSDLDQVLHSDTPKKQDVLLHSVTAKRIEQDINELMLLSSGSMSPDVVNASVSYRNGLFETTK